MRAAVLALALLLTGCAAHAVRPREGAPIQLELPAAAEQCQAQPDLDWCRHAGH